MRFYNAPHRHYCGIDLHARRMYICILDADGQVRVHRNGPALRRSPETPGVCSSEVTHRR